MWVTGSHATVAGAEASSRVIMASQVWNQSVGFTGSWKWLLAMGILLVVLGLILIGNVTATTLASMLVAGVFFLVGGVVQIVHGFRPRNAWAVVVHVLAGILYVLLGLMLITHPAPGAQVVTLLAAFFLFFLGFFRIVLASIWRWPTWGWTLAAGVVDVLLAGLIVRHWPWSGLWVIGMFLAIELLVDGWSTIMLALGVRRIGQLRAA